MSYSYLNSIAIPFFALLNSNPFHLGVVLSNGLLIGWLIDPAAGIYNGLFIGVIYAGLGRLAPIIKSAEATTWSWKSLRRNALLFTGSGVGIGLFYGLCTALYWSFNQPHQILSSSRFVPCLLFGFSVGLVVGSLVLVTRGFSHEKPAQRDKPNQGIWNAARHSTQLGLIALIIVGLMFGAVYGDLLQQIFHLFNVPFTEYARYFPKSNGAITGLTYGLVVGVFLWLRNGGTTCIQHIVLRLLLWRAGCIPWKYPQFLDEAARHILLYKVGGGYIFIHRLLQEYLAAQSRY